MPANASPTYVGLDISRARLEYTLDEQRTTSVENAALGHQRLIRWLKTQPNVRVVCEASGGYERLVVAALLASGIEVCLVQPGRARLTLTPKASRPKMIPSTPKCCAATDRR